MKLKKHILSALAVALSLVLVFAFVACGGNKDPKVTAISLDKTTAEVETDNTVRLTANATYDDETTAELKAGDVDWKSDNEAVATVTRGIVSGKAQGTAKITATYGDYSATCTVTVNAVEVVISGYTANEDGKVDLEIDATLTLSAKVLKNGVELPDEEIEWASSNAGLASVADGVVTAINPGEVTITATRKGGVQSASITVVIPEVEGAEKMDTYEQNKTPADTWGYWGDAGYNWSQTTIYSAYTEDLYEEEEANLADGFSYIGAGKMNMTFSVDKYAGSMKPGAHDAAIQLFYRSSKGNEGQLEVNHNYEIRLTILSNTNGTALVNPYDDNATGYSINEDNEAAHTVNLVANEPQTITVQFRHGDSGKIYAAEKYTNVETALNLLLGLLSAPQDGQDKGNIVKISVYDIQFHDLGESTHQWKDNPAELEGYDDTAIEGTTGKSFEAVYTTSNTDGDTLGAEDTWGLWYVQDGSWNCGAAFDHMNVTLDADAKSCTINYNAGGNANNWGLQLRYIPKYATETEGEDGADGIVVGRMYKVTFTIKSNVAYSITINGKTIALETGDEGVDVVLMWTAGDVWTTTNEETEEVTTHYDNKWALNGQINNAGSSEDINLVISNLTFTEFFPTESAD